MTGAGQLAAALVAEGSLDNQGVAKPSDFYFMAGQQKFLDTARRVLNAVTRVDIDTGLEGPWRYESEILSLGWDVTDDRVYALRANNPSPEKKLTNPGPEALALLGLSMHLGLRGPGSYGHARMFGLVEGGMVLLAALAQACFPPCRQITPRPCLRPPGSFESPSLVPGVGCIHHPPVIDPRRTAQGGYGTFGPPEVVW